MSPLVVITIVWHLLLAALVGWLWWSRRARRPDPQAVRDPVAEPGQPPAPRPRSDIGAGRLVSMIFRSHAVFPKAATEWRGTAGELIAALQGGMSFLPATEKKTLPPAAALARRLIIMGDATGHHLEIEVEERHDDLERVRFRLSINPEIDPR